MNHIAYQGRKYKHIIMNIDGNTSLHSIRERVKGLGFPFIPLDDEHVRYALLELLGNSMRAHQENGTREKITMEFKIQAEKLTITVIDRGGGFDVSTLPYNWNGPIDEIDTDSEKFQEYRKFSQYKRFGMGLLSVRRLFPLFRMSFYDNYGRDVPYSSGTAAGTRVEIVLTERMEPLSPLSPGSRLPAGRTNPKPTVQ